MKLLLTIALIIGLVAGAGKHVHPQGMIPEMDADYTKGAHVESMLKSLKGNVRGFNVQQAEYLLPVSDAEICKGPDFVANLTKVYTLCAFVSVLPLGNSSVPSTTVGIRAAWDDFCNGVCMLAASAVFSTYSVCLHPFLKLQGMSQAYLCNSRDSAGDRCGVTMSKFEEMNNCRQYSYQSSCSAASEFCSWTTATSSGYSYSYCSTITTQATVAPLCGSCAQGLVKLNNQFQKYSDPEVADALSSLCLAAPSGAYCVPMLSQFSQAGISIDKIFLSQTGLESVCGNADLQYCIRAGVGASAANKLAKARGSFVRCAARYANATSSVNSYCLPDYKSAFTESRKSTRNIDTMCLKNSAGKYCLPLALDFLSSTCVLFAIGFDSCSTACASNVSALITNLGCCAGNIQQFAVSSDEEDGPLTPDELPYIPGYTGDTSTPAPTMTLAPAPGTTAPVVVGSGEELIANPVDGGLYELGICNVDGLNQTLRKRCIVSTPVTVSGSIVVPMVYSEIAASPERKLRVKGSLRIDVAATARVPVDSIIRDDIVETTAVKVATAASGRRQSTSANGCKYTYTIQAASTTDANAANSNVNSAAASGRVPLTNTQATLSQECSTTCAGSGGVSSIDQVQSGGSSSSSGVSITSTCLAIVAATLLLLF